MHFVSPFTLLLSGVHDTDSLPRTYKIARRSAPSHQPSFCSYLVPPVTLSQAWHFYSNQSQDFSDPLGLKVLVAVVVGLDFIHQVCTSHWLYMTFVTNFGLVDKLTILPPSYLGMAFPTGFVTFLVQKYVVDVLDAHPDSNKSPSFYVWRIWKLSNKNWLVAGFIFICTCGQEALQIYSLSVVAQNPDSSLFTGTLTSIVIAVNGMGAGIDVIIAIAMVHPHSYLPDPVRVSRTNRVLRQIAIYSVTTGAATGLCAILVFVAALTLPGNWVLTFYLMLTRMYSNSLLATLNVRDSMRAGAAGSSGVVGDSGVVSSRSYAHPVTPTVTSSYRLNDLKRASSSEHEGISIKVDRRTEVGDF
ncbi:hypothetical protein PQX77_017931 [Marasmius sp. AFHP31]|nr:hypothetical protein PQX77_017931 [Marasmius sp. AFHP31]